MSAIAKNESYYDCSMEVPASLRECPTYQWYDHCEARVSAAVNECSCHVQLVNGTIIARLVLVLPSMSAVVMSNLSMVRSLRGSC